MVSQRSRPEVPDLGDSALLLANVSECTVSVKLLARAVERRGALVLPSWKGGVNSSHTLTWTSEGLADAASRHHTVGPPIESLPPSYPAY